MGQYQALYSDEAHNESKQTAMRHTTRANSRGPWPCLRGGLERDARRGEALRQRRFVHVLGRLLALDDHQLRPLAPRRHTRALHRPQVPTKF